MARAGGKWARRARWRPEELVQAEIVNALRTLLPQSALVMAIPNGGHLSPMGRQMIFGPLGGIAGAADLFVAWPGGMGFIEVKLPKPALRGGGISRDKKYEPRTDQLAFAARARALGIPYEVARSVEEAVALVEHWGAPVRQHRKAA